MKKILSIAVIGIFILSGIGVVGISEEAEDFKEKTLKLTFEEISTERVEDYVELSFEESSLFLTNPGKPMLPKVVKTIELPFGVRDVNVQVETIDITEKTVDTEIRPAATPVVLTDQGGIGDVVNKKDEETYASSKLFPSTEYKYNVGCGLNKDGERVTFVSVHIYPVRYIPAKDKIYVAGSADIKVTYTPSIITLEETECKKDMVIIAPEVFSTELERLVEHKNNYDVVTELMTLEEIYDSYGGIDKPEQIKYFIKHAIENWDIKYVLLVGGLKSMIYAKPRDTPNYGVEGWYCPVRYTNCFDHPEHPLSSEDIWDPGVISDLYYADVYNAEGGFEDWNPNGDDYIAAWGRDGVENDTGIDFYPDVYLGRLACRSKYEVRTVVDKIINYESSPADPAWFKKAIAISGDGFLDQEPLNISWDTNGLEEGTYTICGQSINPDKIAGPIDRITVTVDHCLESSVTLNHDDHLQVDSYPAPPITEITSPSNGDILGGDDIYYEPGDREAYCNNFNGWANVEYTAGVMIIRGKSYDPKPYGNVTDVHIWVENEDGDIIFSDWKNGTEMYYEGEWITGEKTLMGGGGALYYMPEDFEKEIVWASNGKLVGPDDIYDAINPGCGFAFLSGHGSPNVWSDHYPGVPGNRAHGSIPSIKVFNGKYTFPFFELPLIQMSKFSNGEKLPVVVIGGCHNSQFNVSMIPGLLDLKNTKFLWTHGMPVPECFSWYMVKMKKGGAIATIGNTGLGYGTLGKSSNIDGLDGGICIEFFKQYGTYNQEILGDAYGQTLQTYANQFDIDFQDHAKSIQQWVLLGDPSLKIGGYE